MHNFEERLSGGHPNSLGNTVQVVEEVLLKPALFKELYKCYFSKDEVVRLRTSNAMKRICKAQKTLLLPYLDLFLVEVAKINQASTQWTLAQLFQMLEADMSVSQIAQAKQLLKNNLKQHSDWIVLNQTMDTLGNWAKKDVDLKKWLKPNLERLLSDTRKSVSKKANKVKQELGL